MHRWKDAEDGPAREQIKGDQRGHYFWREEDSDGQEEVETVYSLR